MPTPGPHHARALARSILLSLALPLAQEAAAEESDIGRASPSARKKGAVSAPRVDIIGKKANLARLPGSGDVIDNDTLESARVFTTNEAVRKIPGIHARDEEGFGLRPNIGIRGLNPTRSTKVTLLEDGIPLAYAPYGDNASYYHPPIERFERIEVLKGAGQVLYGPQTIGGVINYITPSPTEEFRGTLSLAGGNRDYANTRARLSGAGFLIDVMHKQGDGARDNTRSEVRDINLKKVMTLADGHGLTLRANYYTENSTVTYSGITDAEFRNFGARYNPFRNDTFETRRMGLSATHELTLDGGTRLLTNLYGAIFERDWWRQASTTTDTQCGTSFINARLAGQTVNPDNCASLQGRVRNYSVFGIEPRLRAEYASWLGSPAEIEAGLRLHREVQERKQFNGMSALVRSGTVVEDNLRETTAVAAFLQNKFLYGDLSIAPGLRYEYLDVKRTDRRTGGSSGTDTLGAFIPSLGATFQLGPATTLFGGVHRGFAPPRVEDLVVTGTTSAATFTNVGAEKSWNYELGVRTSTRHGVEVQATLFRNDFQRLISVGSVAGGNLPLAQGEALFQGLELGGRFGHPSGFYSTLALTYLPTAEQTTAFTTVQSPVVIANSRAGNRLPYAPRTTATIGAGFLHPAGLDVNLEMVRVSDQFSDFANVGDPATDPNVPTSLPGSSLTASQIRESGQFGRIDAFTVFNATVNYSLTRYKLTLFLTVKNLTDKVHIVDRTRGILPGAPRLIQAGLKWDF